MCTRFVPDRFVCKGLPYPRSTSLQCIFHILLCLLQFGLSNDANAKTEGMSLEAIHLQSVNYLERYVLLIIFNGYLHAKKHNPGGLQANSFLDWLAEVSVNKKQHHRSCCCWWWWL